MFKKTLYVGCLDLYPAISLQFILEVCATVETRIKITES